MSKLSSAEGRRSVTVEVASLSRRSRRLEWLLAAAMLGVVFWAGRSSVSQIAQNANNLCDEPAAAHASSATRGVYPAQRQPKITRTYLVRPTELFRATDSEAEQRYRQQQAKELMDLIRSEVARANRFNVSGIPEMAANDAFMFAQGWVQAVTRTAPDIIDELADEVKSSQCSESSSPAERITLARMTAAMPELATPEGLDCTVQRHPHEDMVLWSALEAWRASGLPKSAAMAEIERAAKDPRTHFHFSSDDEMKRQVLAAQDDEPSAGSEVLTEAVRIDPHD